MDITTHHNPSRSFVAIDVEYADAAQNICQVGIAVVADLEITERRCWLIQPPGNHYDQRTIDKHHITPDMTAHEPTFPEVWPEIAACLQGRELWAHNAESAEVPVIRKNLERHAIDTAPLAIYDSMRLYIRPDRTQWNSGNSLRACIYAVGLSCDNHHDACADAVMCAQLVIAHLQGTTPDWPLSDRLMAEYKAARKADGPQPQQLDLFADSSFTPTLNSGTFGDRDDGTDLADLTRLNTADTNPIFGVNVVLTGFFHVARPSLRDALKRMGAYLKPSITKNIQAIIIGERNVGPAKMQEVQTLIHNGYNIACICGDAELDRLLYDPSLTPADFNIPQAARKALNFTVTHYRRHHHALTFPVNTIAGAELYFPSTGFMGTRTDCFHQLCGNIGTFGNWDLNPQVNIVVLPESSVQALRQGEKDAVIRAYEDYYNSQRSVTFNAEFITEADILKFIRERIVRCGDDVSAHLYTAYLQSAGIDPENDFRFGLKVARRAFEKEQQEG